jgi:trans-aconitate methyltransferase
MEAEDRYSLELETVAETYIKPHSAHVVDSKVLVHDMHKTMPFIEGPLVLELGYGDGVWTSELISRFGHSYVVDGSTKLLTQASRLHGDNNLTAFQSLFEHFVPPDGLLFNTIIATYVLEHVNDPVHLLRIARSWLTRNGKILIIVPNATSFHRELAVLMGIQKTVYDLSPSDRELGHQRVYDLLALRRNVESAGYRITMERGLFLKILPNGMMTEFSDPLLKALVDVSDRLPLEWMANLAMLIEPA